MKNIVLCADGTGNSPERGRGTNVWKLFLAVDQHAHERGDGGTEQIAVYDAGVGTSSVKVKRLVTGAIGIGLGRNIRQLYASLSRNYEEGDRIYLFGFSRGAFTVRSLAGMIHTVGVLDGRNLGGTALEKEVRNRYREYRKSRKAMVSEARRVSEKGASDSDEEQQALGPIHFLGVWDTVGAVGGPFDFARQLFQLFRDRQPHVRGLTPSIRHAYHALAIDEARRTFKPELFDERHSRREAGQTVEQVWFAGVHSNVGGGYATQGLSDVALDWMMTKAGERGLEFVPGAADEVEAASNVHSTLYDSRKGGAAYYRYHPRNIEVFSTRAGIKNGKAKVHVTALDRIARGTKSYAPVTLPTDFEIVGTADPASAGNAGVAGKSEPERIAKHTALLGELNASDTRALGTSRARGLQGWRKPLYWLFVAVTSLLAIFLAGHERGWMWITEGATALSARLEPAHSWIDWSAVEATSLGGGLLWLVTKLFEGAVAIGGLLLPSFVSDSLAPLGDVPELTILLAVVAWALFKWRRHLIRGIRGAGLASWKVEPADAAGKSE